MYSGLFYQRELLCFCPHVSYCHNYIERSRSILVSSSHRNREIHIHCLCDGEGRDDLEIGRELLLDKEGDRKRDVPQSPDWS